MDLGDRAHSFSLAWSKYASWRSSGSSLQFSPVSAASVFGHLDPATETLRGPPHLELRIDLEPARDVHGCEEDVAELVARRLLLQLAQLVGEVGERTGEIRVLEADRLRALLDLARVEQPRQPFRDVVEDALAPLLLALDALPVRAHPLGSSRLDVAEDVRMPAHELLVDAAGHLRQVAGSSLLEQEREEVDLEQEVAELVEQLLVVAGERRVRDLVGLLDRVRDDRRRGLLAVPGALAAQPLRQALQLEEGLVWKRRRQSRRAGEVPPSAAAPQPVVVGAGVVGVVVVAGA